MSHFICARILLRGLILLTVTIVLALAGPAKTADLSDVPARQLAREKHTTDLPGIRKRKVLKVLITHSRTDFFLLNRRPRGLMYELLREYEKHMNKGIRSKGRKTRIVFVPVSFNRLIPDLLEGRGDVAAALLTITPEREKSVVFATKPNLIVNELVVTHKSVGQLKDLKDLSGKWMYVLSGSSYAEHLRELNSRFESEKIKPVEIEEADSYLLAEDILELVNAGIVKLTVIDDFKARLWAKVFPNIVVHENLKIKEGNQIGLAVRKSNPVLQKHLETFLERTDKRSILGQVLFSRYYENARWIKNPNTTIERKKLDQYIELFKKYGKQHGFDYLAVAAQAYFGSNLEHRKKSTGGGIGIMQVMPSTAADANVDISNIEDVENNIHAGVKYLAFLQTRYFSDPALTSENRIAFTLAAYNAGPAKVQKMRVAAAKMGLDPNEWFNHVELAAGRIGGGQIVKYVADVYKYYLAFSLAEKRTEKKAAAK
jgi:membrane-bound lytic murein transglycosylase MltF